jgi:L-rhamnonate dehydratase
VKVTGIGTVVTPFTAGTWLDDRRVSSPMTPFSRFSQARSSWRGPGADNVHVLVRTDSPDVFGVGLSRGGRVTQRIITDHLRFLLEGTEPREIRLRHEEMTRAIAPYAAGAAGSMAVSALELALWDLLARSLNVPLYRILGGAAQPLPYYLTSPGPGGAIAVESSAGPKALKLPMPCGPPDGAEGMRENVLTLRAARESVGGDLPLAVDCFMSWDVPYATEFARRAEPFGLAWIEEPLPPDAVDALASLRRLISPVRVASGEHLFGLPAMYAYLEREAVDVLQIDVTWCGGLSVAQAAASAAISRGVTFAPHASGTQPWAVHLLSTLGPLGLAEVLAGITPGDIAPDRIAPPVPAERPGVGIEPADLGFAY